MQPSLQFGNPCLSPASARGPLTRRRDDLAYQAVTVAAMLVLLCSLWLF